MPTYDFRCGHCGKTMNNVLLRITHDECDRPHCCGSVMGQHFTVPPMVHWSDPVIEPFRNPAAKRGDKDAVITSQRQRREFMKKNDLVDANDIKPPSHQEQTEAVAEMKKSIDAIKDHTGTVPDLV